jgi:hypothetical protein
MFDLSKVFDHSVRIANLSALDSDAVWPNNIEICITRIPIRKRDGYDEIRLRGFCQKLKNHMVKNGIVFFVCYAPTEAKSRPFEICKMMTDVGFNHLDNIIIQKSWLPGKRSDISLVNSHEYVLYFCNGDVWTLDRAPLRKYLNTDESVSCPGNTWTIATGSLDESIPYDLAELLIRMTDCLPGSLVFDPFMGNKSTLEACLKLGHTLYGFEKDSKRMKKYNKVIEDFNKNSQEDK